MKRNNNGITLIALVITIIVLLILAGVTINLTLGDNEIFKVAEQAARNYKEAENKEMSELGESSNTLTDAINHVTGKTLTSKITGADYGKSIDYSVTVKNTNNEDVTLSNWRVFYNDKTTNNVYIILDGYLEANLVPSEAGLDTDPTTYKYGVWSNTDRDTLLKGLSTKSYWSSFAEGVEGATAVGSPSNEMFVNSWNDNPKVNSITLTAGITASRLKDTTKLYILHTSAVENCNGYRLATAYTDDVKNVWYANYYGNVNLTYFDYELYCARPVVCLPSKITGTVGATVSIDY